MLHSEVEEQGSEGREGVTKEEEVLTELKPEDKGLVGWGC